MVIPLCGTIGDRVTAANAEGSRAGKDGRRMAARAAGQARSAAAEAQFTATLAGLEVAQRAAGPAHPV
jgi:hypothetical protein